MPITDRSFEDVEPRIVGPDDERLRDLRHALVVVAHPDDLEGHCGGTVALLTDVGCAIHLVVCSSGEKGTSDRSVKTNELARTREREQLASASRLGIESTTFLRYPDGEVPNNRLLREKIVRQIRARMPDLVITHDPEFPWPAYTAHRDHRAVGRVTLDALYPDARDHLFFPKQVREEGLEPHVTSEAWLIMSRVPDLFVDVSNVMDVKIAARLAHASQVSDASLLDQSFRARAAEIGADHGLSFAEAFKVVRFA